MSSQMDRRYLSLQFWKKVHEKNGSEFQSLFSDVMEKAVPEFQRVRPYGNKGDGGNDGYIPSKGIYYQIYAPENPFDKSAEAAKKMVDDFNKLKNSGWSEISNIKEYHFVFNDKNNGLDIVLESARAQLASENPDITFGILLPRKLEEILLGLNSDQLVSLGFDVDQRKALEVSREYLKGLEAELDRGHANFVSQTLDTMREIVSSQGDEALLLDFELIEARTLQRLEKVPEAKKKYEDLYKRYPKDVRAPLYLAEICAIAGDYSENQRLLDEAKAIDASHWLYLLEILVRKSFLKEKVSISEIDTDAFPADAKIKSDYYRLYGNILKQSEDDVNATAFIERALYFNPEKISNYDAKIAMDINNLISETDEVKRKSKTEEILKEIKATNDKFKASGNIGVRNQVYLNYKQAMLLVQSERLDDFASIVKDTFELILSCHFDNVIDGILTDLLAFAGLPKAGFEKLLTYLDKAERPLSDGFAKRMFLQFLDQGTLETKGKEFYASKKLDNFVALIDDLEEKDYDGFVAKVKDDHQFAVMTCIAINQPDLRKKIIEALPDTGEIHKDRLYLLLEDEAGNADGAFDVLKKMDLSKIGYVDSQKFLGVAKKKEAWDFVLIFGEKILTYEKEADRIVRIKLELFTANFKLGRLPETIKIGEEILGKKEYITLLDENNKAILLCQTVSALLRRNTDEDNKKAKELVETYKNYLSDFESNALLVSEVYLRHNDAKTALEAVVRGATLARRPSPQEYAGLFMVFNTIGNILDIKLVTDGQIEKERFVKFKEEDGWYFVGDGESLDAQPIPSQKQKDYIGKKVGEKITIANAYASDKKEKTIENILPIEKYIMWQTYHHFQKLSLEGMWDAAVSIEVPQTEDGGIDLKNVEALMKAQQERGQEFFNNYCDQNLPFALLVVSEGGFTNAIGRIQNEQRGFIRMSDGTMAEFKSQKDVVTRIIANKEPFYLDGTSAWVLAETGLLRKLHPHLPNIKVPQSVISLLLEIKDKLSYTPGQAGQMFYSKGKIGYSELNPEARDLAGKRISETIALLELNTANIGVISSASKEDVFSEREIPASVTDATILAQREGIPVLTEDFLYLHMNELETKKPKPQYFSSFVLMRVLYEQGRISFQEYLDYFSYLASYRFRFLQFVTQDLEKAVFGDGAITVVQVENLKKLHLPLTLSAEYGVNPDNALKLVFYFILKLLIDDSVPVSVVEKIYTEIMSTYPTDKNRVLLGRALISASVKAINENKTIVVGAHTQEKIDAIARANEKLDPSASLIISS
ncbi:MAG TPA: hypothetical protein VGE35_03715 [Candidatus Paceibacterota bacterium]